MKADIPISEWTISRLFIRKLIDVLADSPFKLDSLLLSCFPDAFMRLSTGMDRASRINLLFELVNDDTEILRVLQHSYPQQIDDLLIRLLDPSKTTFSERIYPSSNDTQQPSLDILVIPSNPKHISGYVLLAHLRKSGLIASLYDGLSRHLVIQTKVILFLHTTTTEIVTPHTTQLINLAYQSQVKYGDPHIILCYDSSVPLSVISCFNACDLVSFSQYNFHEKITEILDLVHCAKASLKYSKRFNNLVRQTAQSLDYRTNYAEKSVTLLRKAHIPWIRPDDSYLCVSDTHLSPDGMHGSDAPYSLYEMLLDRNTFRTIVLLGDIVESWHIGVNRCYSLQMSNRTRRLFSLLRSLSKQGRLIVIPGNHDTFARRFLSEMLGPQCIFEKGVQSGRLKLVHGHEATPSWTVGGLAAALVLPILRRIAKSIDWFDMESAVLGVARTTRNQHAILDQNDKIYTIFGHTHLPYVSALSANCGSFLRNQQKTFIEISNGYVSLLEYHPSCLAGHNDQRIYS